MKVLLVSEGKHEESGALESLVIRLSPQIESCTWDRVSRVDVATLHGKGRGYFKRVLRWAIEARKRDYDALVLVIDQDGHPERIRELDEAQGNTTIPIPKALGIAIPVFDAWMLADEQALSAVLKFTVSTQPEPEFIRDAKLRCASLLQMSTSELSQRDFYAQVAQVLNLERLEQRCPKGFGVFAARVRAMPENP
jgi:hypothetical protein